MSTRSIIIEANQKSKDNLLQILLYEKYKEYKNKILFKNNTTEEKDCIEFPLLSSEEWLEKVLGEF